MKTGFCTASVVFTRCIWPPSQKQQVELMASQAPCLCLFVTNWTQKSSAFPLLRGPLWGQFSLNFSAFFCSFLNSDYIFFPFPTFFFFFLNWVLRKNIRTKKTEFPYPSIFPGKIPLTTTKKTLQTADGIKRILLQCRISVVSFILGSMQDHFCGML